jgi:hypothetical protein
MSPVQSSSIKPTTDLCVVTSYFNPARYQTKRANYVMFANALLNSRIALHTIELAFDDMPFELEASDAVVQMRGGAILWQKERLLNLLLEHVPTRFTKIAWVDADLLFERTNWAVQASCALDEVSVLQPFSNVACLPVGATHFIEGSEAHASFAATVAADHSCLARQRWAAHGHTGFAWAARRAVLEEIGFYDTCVAGSADHLMAHAFCGDARSRCIDHIVGRHTAFRQHFEEWSQRAFDMTLGNIGCVGGRVLHLWHGNMADRRYYEQCLEALSHNFDPDRDLAMNSQGLWDWSGSCEGLREWSRDYFAARREDS